MFRVIPDEESFINFLSWPQVKDKLPEIHALASNAQLLTQMQSGLQRYFSSVGKAFKKPSAGLLLSSLPVDVAVDVSNTNSSYIYNTRAKGYQRSLYVILLFVLVINCC